MRWTAWTAVPASVLVLGLWGIWGTTFLIIKIGVAHTTPYVFVALRVAVSVAVLIPVVALRRSPSGGGAARRYGLGLAFLNVAAFLPIQTAGIERSDVGISAIVIYTQPLIVAVLARHLLGERLTRRQLTGLLLGWVGVATAAVAGLNAGAAPPSGIVLLLTAALLWAAGSVLFKSVPAAVDVWSLLFWQNLYALPVVVAVAVLTGGTTNWGAILLSTGFFVGAASGVGGFGLLFMLLRRGQANVVSSLIYAVPVISAALGVVVRGERLTLPLVLGALTVGVGIYLVTGPMSGREPPLRSRSDATPAE